MSTHDVVPLLKATFANWSSDDAGTFAAALAYFSAFALAPLLIVIIEIGAALLGGAGHHHVVRDEILRQLRPTIGDASTKAIGDLVQSTFNQRRAGTLATILGWILFVAAATGLFAAVQNALDRIWHVRSQASGIKHTLVIRLKSVAIIGLFAVVLLLSLAANTGLTAFAGTLAASLPGRHYLLIAAQAGVSFIVVTIALAALYKYLPQTSISWKDVLTGSAISAVLVLVGEYLIALYLARVSTGSTYGAAGSFVALLIWLYYSAQIFLFGAEFTKTYASRYGSHAQHATTT